MPEKTDKILNRILCASCVFFFSYAYRCILGLTQGIRPAIALHSPPQHIAPGHGVFLVSRQARPPAGIALLYLVKKGVDNFLCVDLLNCLGIGQFFNSHDLNPPLECSTVDFHILGVRCDKLPFHRCSRWLCGNIHFGGQNVFPRCIGSLKNQRCRCPSRAAIP